MDVYQGDPMIMHCDNESAIHIKVCTVFLIIGTVHMHVIVKEDACLFDFLPFSIVL